MMLDTHLPVEQPSVTWRAGWLRGPLHDLAMALLWIPFALAALAVGDNPEHLRWLVSATLLFSFAHQPLTLWLVYADAGQRRAHAPLVLWAPIVLVVAIAIGASATPALVVLVAGVWNVAHTLRQRYGLCKLYGRLGGIDCGADNRLLWSWLVSAVLIAFAGTNLGSTARAVGLGPRNRGLVELVASAHDVVSLLVPVALVATILMSAQWFRRELQRSTHSTTRLVYLGSTAALLTLLAINPVAGFVAYIGAHAAEYFFVVRWRLDRAAERTIPGDRVGSLARQVGGAGTLALYAIAVIVLIVSLRVLQPGAAGPVIVLTLGALHLLFDGVIWRSPRPATSNAQ
jgi:hypothetical protein